MDVEIEATWSLIKRHRADVKHTKLIRFTWWKWIMKTRRTKLFPLSALSPRAVCLRGNKWSQQQAAAVTALHSVELGLLGGVSEAATGRICHKGTASYRIELVGYASPGMLRGMCVYVCVCVCVCVCARARTGLTGWRETMTQRGHASHASDCNETFPVSKWNARDINLIGGSNVRQSAVSRTNCKTSSCERTVSNREANRKIIVNIKLRVSWKKSFCQQRSRREKFRCWIFAQF